LNASRQCRLRQPFAADPFLVRDARIAGEIIGAHRLARLRDPADLERADGNAAVPAVEAFRETGAGDEMETARPIRTVRRLDALGAQVSRAKQPDARERGVEVFHQPTSDLREHVCELERARHPQADPSEATLDARDAHGGPLN